MMPMEMYRLLASRCGTRPATIGANSGFANRISMMKQMPIMAIRIRDPWANRRLSICARSFKALPRPAKQLVEYLRKAAE